MIEIKRVILLISLLALLFTSSSCAKKKDELITFKRFTLDCIDSVIIRVNDKTNVQGTVQLISWRDAEWLSCYQYEEGVNNFHLYDLNSLRYLKTMKFEVEGPNGVGRVSPIMAFISFDSIFLYRINTNIFYHVDSSGTIQSTIDLSVIESGTVHVSAWFPPKIIDKKLHFFRIGPQNPNSRIFLKESKAEGVFDLVSGKYKNGQPSYPDYPHGFEVSMENWKVSRCLGPNDAFVYSFPFDNRLHVYKNGQVNRFTIPNNDRPVNSSVEATIDPLSFESQMQFTATVGMYTYLQYDPFNYMYYRIYLRPGNYKDIDGNVIRVADFAWNLELIDTAFNLVGTYFLPAKQYNPYGVMVSKKGLLVSTTNPYNPSQENFMTFRVFKPVPEILNSPDRSAIKR